MEKVKYRYLMLLWGSFAIAYSFYVFILQPPTFVSRMRLMISLSFWALLLIIFFIFLRFGESRQIFQLDRVRLISGLSGFFAFINLFIAATVDDIPYTFLLLPTQTVSIIPKSGNHSIELTSFNTELIDGISLGNFESKLGWTSENKIIISENTQVGNLVWRGKPGQFVELSFNSCIDCGEVIVDWGSGDPQEIDLSLIDIGKSIYVRHQYPPLLWHRAVNLIFLEASVVVLSLIFTYLGVWVAKDRVNKQGEPKSAGKQFHRFFPLMALFGLTIIVYGLDSSIKCNPVMVEKIP